MNLHMHAGDAIHLFTISLLSQVVSEIFETQIAIRVSKSGWISPFKLVGNMISLRLLHHL